MAERTSTTKIPTTPYWPTPRSVDPSAPASRIIKRSHLADAVIDRRFNRWKPWVAIAATKLGADANRAIADARLLHHLRCLRLLDAGIRWPAIKGDWRGRGRELDDPRITDADFDALFDAIRRKRQYDKRSQRPTRRPANAHRT